MTAPAPSGQGAPGPVPSRPGDPELRLGVEARAVAAGFAGADHARVTVLLHPVAPGTGVSQPAHLWPDLLQRLARPAGDKPAVRLVFRVVTRGVEPSLPQGSNGERPVTAEVEATMPDRDAQRRIRDLWQRAMVPGCSGDECRAASGWAPLLDALACPAAAPAASASLIVPSPDAEAALAFTLERGRMVLDALAGPGSVLHGRPGARDPAPPLPDRVLMAALPGPVTDAAPDVLPHTVSLSQLDRYRMASATLHAGGTPGPLWPSPAEFAQAALSDGTTLEPLVQRIREVHAAVTPAQLASAVTIPQARLDREKEAAQRRLGTILTLPVLQRLFAFAVDVTVPLAWLRDLAGSGSPAFLLIGLATDAFDTEAIQSRVWTVARFETGCFVPATKEELLVLNGDNEFMNGWSAMRNLGVPTLDAVSTSKMHPRYDLCTIDPATTTEGDLVQDPRRAAAAARRGAEGGSGETPVVTLRNGGLRLVDRARINDTSKAVQAPGCPAQASRIEYGDDLAVGDRLMIGLRLGTGVLDWRCPQFRTVSYKDPRAEEVYQDLGYKTAAAARDWVEDELKRRFGPPSALRRLELDAGTLMGAHQQEEDTPETPPANETEAQKTAREDADKRKQLLTKQRRILTWSTLASWGGEPMAVPAVEAPRPGAGKPAEPGRPREWSSWVIDELDVSRRFEPVTTGAAASQPNSLNPLLRFGWPYYAALPRVFDGGYCLSQGAVAAAAAAHRGLVLPRTSGQDTTLGRRFLRHERVDAPMVLMPEAHWTELRRANGDKDDSAQAGAMILRTGEWISPSHRVPETRRVLVAPPVALHFAALHDVLHGVRTSRPPAGLAGASILRAVGAGGKTAERPALLRIGAATPGEPAPPPYYPDPATSLLVIGLFARSNLPPAGRTGDETVDVEQPGEPVGEPLVVPVQAGWPDTPPVHISLSSGEGAAKLVHVGRRFLTRSGQLLPRQAAGTLAVEAVELNLQPGADLWVQAWFVPTREQLAAWFDAPEAACALAVTAGGGGASGAATAAASGLAALGCLDGGGPEDGPACRGAGGLLTSVPATRLLAGMVHARMLRGPLPFLSATLAFRALHAVGEAVRPTVANGALQVTRRLTGPTADGTAELLTAFLGATQEARWSERTIELDATAAVFGGEVEIDLATTEAVELITKAASLSSDALQRAVPGNRSPVPSVSSETEAERVARLGFTLTEGRVSFPQEVKVMLRLDGLPVPADGEPRRRTYRLEELQAAALGRGKPLGGALRATMPTAVTTHGARLLKLAVRAVLRNGGLVDSARLGRPDRAGGLPGDSVDAGQLWLLSTRRPPPPDIDRLQVTLSEQLSYAKAQLGVQRVTKVRPCTVRIWLGPPWCGSGEGEMLGVVLWPPNLAAEGMGLRDMPGPPDDAVLLDEDIGPAGEFVSRWGEDPIDAEAAFPAAGLFGANQVRAAPGQEREIFVARAWLPVPSQGGGQSPDLLAAGPPAPTQVAATAAAASATAPVAPNGSARFMAVSLAVFQPRFDPVEELWFVDLALDTGTVPRPRVRLGLVRYQPHAREDDLPLEAEEPVRLRVSQPVKEYFQPLAHRRTEASWSTHRDGGTVLVTVSGPSTAAMPGAPPVRMEVELVRFRQAVDEMQLEEPVHGAAGRPVGCDKWSSWPSPGEGVLTQDGGVSTWTCELTWPRVPDAEGWDYAVLVKERTQRKGATEEDKMLDSGATLFARLELRPA